MGKIYCLTLIIKLFVKNKGVKLWHFKFRQEFWFKK